jgi:hypothetical protein
LCFSEKYNIRYCNQKISNQKKKTPDITAILKKQLYLVTLKKNWGGIGAAAAPHGLIGQRARSSEQQGMKS